MNSSEKDDKGVVSLGTRRIAAEFPKLMRMQSYWDSLRSGRLVPDRADVDPRDLSGVLENAFVLERIAPSLARFRVAGSCLTTLIGLEVRGMPISAIFTSAGRPRLAEALETVFAEPAVVTLEVAAEEGIGRPPLLGRMALLPLRAETGDISRVLGAFEAIGKVGRPPRRLAVTGISHRTLTGYANPLPPAPDRAPAPTGFSERRPSYEVRRTEGAASAARRVSRKPYLRLVKSDAQT